jgi:hypothetical protein
VVALAVAVGGQPSKVLRQIVHVEPTGRWAPLTPAWRTGGVFLGVVNRTTFSMLDRSASPALRVLWFSFRSPVGSGVP